MKDIINDKTLLVHYTGSLEHGIGHDSSAYGNHAIAYGKESLPESVMIEGRSAIKLVGGQHGSSYLQLPATILQGVNDYTGLTVTTWVYLQQGQSVWERLFDFGAGPTGPYLFLTRNLRGVCFAGEDLAIDPNKALPTGEWVHVAIAITGTLGATASSAGPMIFINGDLAVDGRISQTTSGTYLKYRQWISTLEQQDAYSNNYIGHSQFDADHDFNGAISDFRIYAAALEQEDIIDLMCQSLSDEQVVEIAAAQQLAIPSSIVTSPLELPSSILSGRVELQWESSDTNALQHNGQLADELSEPSAVTLTVTYKRNQATAQKSFALSVLPSTTIPYEIILDSNKQGEAVSPVMYGLFYEDINNAADGGIYAELIRNRSFEAFTFDSFSHVCGENAHSTGRKRTPLEGWYGDLDAVEVKHEGGLNEHFGITEQDVNITYITAQAGAVLYNRGYNDTNHHCAMSVRKGDSYQFTIWAKSDKGSIITVQLHNEQGATVSDVLKIAVDGDGQWRKYGELPTFELSANETTYAQLSLAFSEEASVDMVSLFPQNVWGATAEPDSPSATLNYKGNANYRLRRDMVQALQNMKPTFLRFPGGCISEGSHVWDNVYDWKHSVGDVEKRKENFNVWGYMMTLGLGYMEYFQLAEDLNATPLPVMACGVLCQARSDYANPAGGTLRDYYIKNFTDLIDFAISEDFEHNEWAKMRKHMGHPAPFELKYLGVGNENWGTEFFANFEKFKVAIDAYMKEQYPGHELIIISTVGAQADDDAYQQGWKFLSGAYEGSEVIAFTDGCTSTTEEITWYEQQEHYMDTIVDEHYYRSNDYLLRNADRYNYYYRAYDDNGKLDETRTSKVFVGEYASNDKNTLAGAIAEAAIMTGFENNADVVRLAAYAPLFNKVLTDGSYRWTPDCIWFDDESIWFTPNYYVQQMFATYLGTETVASQYRTYRQGKQLTLKPQGGIQISSNKAELLLKYIAVISNETNNVLFEQDFSKPLLSEWSFLASAEYYEWQEGHGLTIKPVEGGRTGLYIDNEGWSNYRVEVVVEKINGEDGVYVGVGLSNANSTNVNVLEYVIGERNQATGLKVYKQGIEGYTLGDFASSSMAGNMRAVYDEQMIVGQPYHISVNYGGDNGAELRCQHAAIAYEVIAAKQELAAASALEKAKDAIKAQSTLLQSPELTYKLEAYNDEIFYSITKDEKHLYMKLVNADAVSKPLSIHMEQYKVKDRYTGIVLTGDQEKLHIPNVNKKNAEVIQPQQQVLTMKDGKAYVELPANSVQVLVWELV